MVSYVSIQSALSSFIGWQHPKGESLFRAAPRVDCVIKSPPSTLEVEEIESPQIHNMAQELTSWSVILEQRYKAHPRDKVVAMAIHVTRLFFGKLQGCIRQGSMGTDRLFVCRDKRRQIQGMLSCGVQGAKEIHVYYLLAHPDNLTSSSHPKEGQVRGAGSALMRRVEEEARMSRRRRIRLEFSENAKKFYERRGFVVEQDEEGNPTQFMTKAI